MFSLPKRKTSHPKHLFINPIPLFMFTVRTPKRPFTSPIVAHRAKRLFAPLLFVLLMGAQACSNDAPPMGETVRNRDSLPVMTTYGVSKLISDSGVMRYKIISEEWRVYDKTTPPRWEFPQGIFVLRYDNNFKPDMHICADSAWLYNQETWKLIGHVELDDKTAGSHLQTEELYWNMNTGEMRSDVYTKLTEPLREIEGDWFRATMRDGVPTRYHVKQSKGFMPMKDMNDNPSTPQAAPTDTAASATESQPLRSGPSSRPRSR